MEEGKNLIEQILDYRLLDIGNYMLTVSKLLTILLIIIVTKILLWGIKKTLFNARKFKATDKGSLYSLNQIISYAGWIIAITIILDTIGLKITVLLTGSAALLVGVGLGLQQTFNDFISGIILLLEGKTKVGDVLQMDDDVVMLKKIGLRTSEGIDRDDISIIIPNSKIINDKVINWSHQSKNTRFRLDVGVAYGSDVDKVVEILEESILEHPDISNKELVEARFVNFGSSSLDFQVLFFSRNIFRIEKVKSEMRKIIVRKFNESGITIPFPQMDVYVKPNTSSKK